MLFTMVYTYIHTYTHTHTYIYIYTYIAIGKDMIKYKHYILHTRIYMHDMLCNMIYIYTDMTYIYIYIKVAI